ncbi:TPA: TM0106 family RecB-like putative nuclease [Legionella pneumophila subsp. pneumophila]|uniref:TM0106 family RecB-like putative nuclease n=1 Tax=Legionella taurinensis TaxID=70611 RepID=UPI000E72F802|nr:TM0106 family RecB-like putative nuclease [Legionella taurinensis]RJT67912.1 TM0106 family RecB-like putative nuclease [Legionella taurinensis]HAT8891287.1 TM0106 family RecB-like putative nuclease [Legionella pneumophila subsp. pneumophila]
MYLESKQIVFSPSDLTKFMESPFASWMEHLTIIHPDLIPSPDESDELLDVLHDMGNQHESEVLAEFETKGLTIANLRKRSDSYQATIDAMKNGADVIYQAHLELLPFKGYADFLIKVPGKSIFGDYCYEIWDTKLAKSVKAYFLVQLCCYAEMLGVMQQKRAEHITIILGNKEQKRFRLNDYFYFYQNLKQKFLSEHLHFEPNKCPDPASSRSWGRWSTYAESLLLKADHLIQVATITSGQIKKLNKAGINTMTALAEANSNTVKGMKPELFERLKAQAKIQKESIGKKIPAYQLIDNDDGKKQGLALLPPLSKNDIFFDIEGFPLEDGGLEYLWGVAYFDDNNQRQYMDFWAHDRDQEKESFRAFIEWTYQRWQQDPSMHIYHYASYEITACRKLMSRYGVCEYEVDQLLRNEVFVDLYKIVKGALLIGEPRYSIKNVEHLYRAKRDTEVGSGGDSVVVYERWRENPDGDTWQTSKVLNDIRSYNIDDCNSTQELVVWLRDKQKSSGICFLGKTELVEPEVKEAVNESIKLRDNLLARAAQLKDKGQEQLSKINMVMAWSIEFHRRESKPVFWRLFDRLGLSHEELLDDIDCLAFCYRTEKPPYKPTPRSNLVYEYSFDPDQEFKGNAKDYYLLGNETADGKNIKATYHAEGSDLEHGIIALKIKDEPDSPITLIPNEYVKPDPIPQAIKKQAKAFAKGELAQTAIVDFLGKSIPRINAHNPGQPIAPSHDPKQRLNEIIQAVINLNNSYLTIQGPPGAGKTYTGKHLIAELIKRGKRVGISSNSHKAINNLLISTAQYCHKEGITGYFACASNTDPAIEDLKISVLENKDIAGFLQTGCVVGTTAWGFSRDDLENAFDYLFIDEAGQVSVANLIAMSQSTSNIILMGDQMQLGQPSQGSHPEDSGLSILDYLLHSTPTIPDSMGVFLGTTYRMHAAVNHFISEAIYEGKLETAPESNEQLITVPAGYHGVLNKEAGIITVPVMHEGNTQASDEEIEQIVVLAHELLGRTFNAKNGQQRMIDWKDILFVAPYNYQVNKLKAALGDQARVGSVDKFQGQEAPVVFLSMCASSANESPRGLNFLFDKNRINVAVSRAQCMAIVVYSPALLDSIPNNVDQITMMNLFCQLVKE